MIARHALVVGCAGFTLLSACSESGGGTNQASADGPAALGGPDVQIEPSVQQEYSIGTLEGAGWETFGRVTDVAFDAEGNLFVLDQGASRVVELDPRGQHVRTIGRPGEGPGELLQPIGLAVLQNGEMVLFDLGHMAFQVFSSDGEFLRSVPVRPDLGIPGMGLLPMRDGDLLSVGGFKISADDSGLTEEKPQKRPVGRFSLADGRRTVAYEAWDLPPLGTTDAGRVDNGGGQRFQFSAQRTRAFQPGLFVGVLAQGGLAVVDSIGYRVKLLDVNGRVTGSLERPIPPRPVTSAIREQERERRLEQISQATSGSGTLRIIGSSSGSGGSMSIGPEAVRKMQEAALQEMTFADEVPVIAGMKVDWEGRIWVERTGAKIGEDGPTDVITPDGRYLGTIAPDGVRIPDAFGPGGRVAYIEKDELDVQRIRVGRLIGLESRAPSHHR